MTMLDWTMGLVAGRVDALAVHPTSDDTLYLGAAAGGVWKSTNGGGAWQPIFDDVGTETIGAIAIDPAAPERVWVGTGEHAENCWGYFGMGLFLSTDGGDSWSARNGSEPDTLDLSYVASILLHPTEDQSLLVAGDGFCAGGGQLPGGIFRTSDGGTSWARVLTGDAGDLSRDPADPLIVLAAVGQSQSLTNGVYRSIDGGATWNQIPFTSFTPQPTTIGRLRLARAASSPAVVYALANVRFGAPQQSATWIYKSVDGGTTWTRTQASACEGQCSYNLSLDVHPTNPDEILVGTIRFARSTNSGTSLTYLVSGWGSAQKVHQDTHILRYSRLTPNRFWVGSDGGLWRTDNGGQPPGAITFSNLNAGLDITQFYDVAVHPDDADVLFGGAQDNSSSGRFLDSVWNVTEVTGDGFMNLVDPANPQRVFQTSYPWESLPSLLFSPTGGTPSSFCWVGTSGMVAGNFPWVTPLAIYDLGAATPSYVYVGSERVYRGDASGGCSIGWTAVSGDLTPASASAISVLEPVRSAGAVRLYVATENGLVHRSDDVQVSSPAFADVTGNLPGGWIADLEADPAFPNRVFAVRSEFGGALFRSDVGGTSWAEVGVGLPDLPTNAVAVDPLAIHRVFVANDIGVYVSRDFGSTFEPLMAGLPLGVPVVDLEIDDDPHALVAGTYGRGAWRVDLDDLRLLVDGFESAGTGAWSEEFP